MDAKSFVLGIMAGTIIASAAYIFGRISEDCAVRRILSTMDEA